MNLVERTEHVFNIPPADKLEEIRETLIKCHESIAQGKETIWKLDHKFREDVQKILG
jgi:hypothetical protein